MRDEVPLDVRGVIKTFHPSRLARLARRKSSRERSHVAVRDVSFRVTSGEIYGVIGANGSGKSTLIRILSTLLLPDEGEVWVFGRDAVHDALAVRGLINRVSADPSFFRAMSAMENLLFFGRAYGMTPDRSFANAAGRSSSASVSTTTGSSSPCCISHAASSRRSRSPARS